MLPCAWAVAWLAPAAAVLLPPCLIVMWLTSKPRERSDLTMSSASLDRRWRASSVPTSTSILSCWPDKCRLAVTEPNWAGWSAIDNERTGIAIAGPFAK